ncbi:outer membrane lipoprotein carrier protein LolA [Amaricoccus sp.]|uniref:outer membrane lipoprotein carrier protein LolA n=1 Tax=Amaricoccus sp. TaxID=1872485 RepID=UPI001B65FA2D|nr:outer membrane lipoprotein carrier protein LolA [Amaricoccus sp.]MBP7241088.1 outer membrane lipoprotein carrier protein LolA [Amaricoccus sp.]
MDRRTLVAALAAAALAPRLAAAQSVDVSAIDAYLRRLRTAEGRFRQTNPNGSVQTGRVYLSRPGRMRFEYDAPKGAMVIADGVNVAVFDPKSSRVSTRYPLGRTPLSLLLRDDVSLREPGMVRGATRDGGEVTLTVVDPRMPDEGRLALSFAENPVALRRWVVTTKAGQRTAVDLSGLRTGVALDRSLFNIELAEIKAR